jgi:exodeoxyribonuclease VII large subunit
LDYCRSHLDKMSPLAILKRGYAVATLLPQETVIRDAAQTSPGAAVRVRVARGRLDCEVKELCET